MAFYEKLWYTKFKDINRTKHFYFMFSAKHHVLVYLEDSIAQLLEHREENPKINPVKILSE